MFRACKAMSLTAANGDARCNVLASKCKYEPMMMAVQKPVGGNIVGILSSNSICFCKISLLKKVRTRGVHSIAAAMYQHNPAWLALFYQRQNAFSIGMQRKRKILHLDVDRKLTFTIWQFNLHA